jgi:hypothetical protein
LRIFITIAIGCVGKTAFKGREPKTNYLKLYSTLRNISTNPFKKETKFLILRNRFRGKISDDLFPFFGGSNCEEFSKSLCG